VSDHIFLLMTLALAPVFAYMSLAQSKEMVQKFETDTRVCDSTFIRRAPLVQSSGQWVRGLFYAVVLVCVWAQPASRIASGRYSLQPEFPTKSDFMKHFSRRDIARSVTLLALASLLSAFILLGYFLEVP